jgi:monoamine oxidase
MDHGPPTLTVAAAADPRHPPPPERTALTRRQFLALSVPAAVAACGGARTSGGVREERARVVVIGAGLAGLAAAHELARTGVEVRVLEARGRPGGRVHTLRAPFDDGLYAEAGAVFVPSHHATTHRYLREFGLALHAAEEGGRGIGERVFIRGTSVRHLPGSPTRWPVPLKPREMGLGPGELRSLYLHPVVEAIGDPEHPLWPGPSALQFDGMTMEQLLRARGASPGAIALMRLGYLDEWGDGIGSISALALLRDLAGSRGGSATHRIAGGSDRLPAAFAQRLGDAIRYGAQVTAIERRRSGVRVAYTAAGRPRTIAAEHVVCAIPFTVLRRLAVDPPFSPAKRSAVARLPATSVTRVYLQLREGAWNTEDGGAVATDLPVMLAANATAGQPGPRGIVEAFVTGREARALARMSPDACVRGVRAQLAQVIHGMDARVERAAVYAWDADPWARGDYAWFRPGQMRALLPHLATAEGRIHFAGDHTSSRPGWMQGALDSGLRAAAEVAAALGDTRADAAGEERAAA